MTDQRQDQDRTVRVFVSSTFQDMQAERDELVLRIFPQIRRLYEERGVTWGEVDLRWGISVSIAFVRYSQVRPLLYLD